MASRFLQTERDGQDKRPERLRGEADCVSLVQYGKKLPETVTPVSCHQCRLVSDFKCGTHERTATV